ncbi:cell division protein FtsQ/DivIB [Tenuibacillus multivorans]|uniref:Cell division protein DivIB n=1 Tax=Tenuibacillus multivorans TaxID=237069 RepID=A0A1G9Y611_9BACI|nr:FtsQ-type POTRA domain-containing protein [Tenuibacillus multivorans]GEL75964.1 cell division protein DivIB [Tenuibacillus multivorans]SDN04572.1 cell division protein FtsQ [Tenuibacillus multivorans]
MAEKKVVSIEDRIPQLKQERKKKANRRFFTYLTVILLLILVIVYLQSPFSHIQSINVTHNRVVSEDDILDLSGLSTTQSFWTVDADEVEQKIEKHLEINEVNIERKWYNQINIDVQEFSRVGYVKSSNLYFPVLETGKILEKNEIVVPKGDAPIIYGFSDEELLGDLTNQLAELDPSIVQLISEIYWDPDDSNHNRIRMFTTDGQEVIASIHNFLDKMSVYPSISAQLTPEMEGVLYIDVGAYFQPYKSIEEIELESAEEDTTS